MLGQFIVMEDKDEQNDIYDTQQRAQIARPSVHVELEFDSIDLETLITKRNKRQSKGYIRNSNIDASISSSGSFQLFN